jgi:hypothetical protein
MRPEQADAGIIYSADVTPAIRSIETITDLPQP